MGDIPLFAELQGVIASTYWNRVEPRPRAPEIADTLAARIRDPLWMLTRQWQFGEFHGEDAGSPAFVQLGARTAPMVGWRPAGAADLRPIDAPLEELVATEAFTPDLATRVELGQLFEAALAAQNIAAGDLGAIVAAFRRDYALPAAGVAAGDAPGDRLFAVCDGRAIDGVAAAAAHAAGAPLPADPAVAANAAKVGAALDALVTDAEATLGTIGSAEAPAWRADQLEYAVEAVAALPSGGGAVLRADANRDARFDWFAFDVQGAARAAADVNAVRAPAAAAMAARASRLPTHLRFKGMPNPRWWDFEPGTTDFGAVTPDRRDLAKLIVMDFMLIHGNDYFVVPYDMEVGSVCRIDELLVHDVFGGITLVDRADAQPAAPSRRWTCFSLADLSREGAPADFFLLPPSAAAATISGEALEDVRFVRDEQANYVWAIEHATEGSDGRPWLGHERSIAQSAGEPAGVPPVTDSPLVYQLQTFVPRNWLPLVPVSLDALSGETAFELGRMVRPGGDLPEPAGRILRPPGSPPYRIREEALPRVGVRVVREPARSRWLLGATHLWVGRRRLVGRGEGSSGLRFDGALSGDGG
jgi:hypothetical protein